MRKFIGHNSILIFVVGAVVLQPSFAQVYGVSTQFSYGPDTILSVRLNGQYPAFLADCRSRAITRFSNDCVQYIIELRNAPADPIIQTIIDTSTVNVDPSFEFVDINLDGFVDIKLTDRVYSLGSESYHFWTFDRDSGRFVFNHEFSELSGDLEIDSVNKFITATFREHNVPVCEDKRTYNVVGSHLILVKHVWDEQALVGDSSMIKTFIEKLVDGKMKLVEVIGAQ